jgi:hypothetical protein
MTGEYEPAPPLPTTCWGCDETQAHHNLGCPLYVCPCDDKTPEEPHD